VKACGTRAEHRTPEGESETGPTVKRRVLLTRFLLGQGVELGRGHHPFPLLFGGATVRYVDRWEPTENRALFPELGEEAGVPDGLVRWTTGVA